MTRTVRCHCVVALFDGSLQAASMMSKHGNILFSKISPECHNTEKKKHSQLLLPFPGPAGPTHQHKLDESALKSGK